MPLIGSTAYNTLGQVTSLMRSLLNDAAGNWATDTVLLPYANSGYRTVQRKVANAGGGGFITDNTELIVAAVPAASIDPGTQVVLNDATAPPNQLPSNLLLPLVIKERPNGSNQDFADMRDLTLHGGLPSRRQMATLNEWEWRQDGIYFVGATQDTQIRLRYTSAFPDLSGPTDIILIRGAQEAIAYAGVGLSGLARGSPLAEKIDQIATDAIEDVIVMNVRAQQNAGVRRRPFNRRRSGSLSGMGWNW
jgi:hypothetical protein